MTLTVKRVGKMVEKPLFVAITWPKNENFVNRWRDPLGVTFIMDVGEAFDVVAGKVTRVPVWVQDAGLEVFYRMLHEPRRVWMRYLPTNVAFAGMLARAEWQQLTKEPQ